MKRNQPLWRISVVTSLEAEEAVVELLAAVTGQAASSHLDVEKQVCVVSVFGPNKNFSALAVRADISTGLKRIKSCGLKIGAGKITIVRARREDWAESWKHHFKPIEIGAALLIKPSWIKRRSLKNQAVVILDPGLSFGTGHHATTSYCLSEIAKFSKQKTGALLRSGALARPLNQSQSFLDIGTGSGILAIAAAKLGYKPAQAFDFDAESIRVARTNARVNGVERKMKVFRQDVRNLTLRPFLKFDLVCANLISTLLIAERRKIVAQMNRGGMLVLAGILKSEFAQVQAAFEELGLHLIRGRSEKEWRSGTFCHSAK